MRERLVLDASAALAILRGETGRYAVLQVLAAPEARELLVPDHFWLEVMNVLIRRHRHSLADALDALVNLDELGLATAPIDRPLLLLVLDAMAAHGLSAYDAGYLVLAVALDADLVTLDVKLAIAAGERDVLGTRRRAAVSDERTAYGSTNPVAAWAGFGSYLAKLRAEAIETAL
jgi:predicted nucleic acid-binding protein